MKWFKPLKSTTKPHLHSAESAFVDTPAIDDRWRLLATDALHCGCCGVNFKELLSIGYSAPEDWPHPIDKQDNHVVDLKHGDFLTQDLCKLGERRFVRAVMPLPLVGLDIPFLVGIWVEITVTDFEIFVATLPSGNQGSLDIMFCTMANIVPPFRPNLPFIMKPRDDFQRPVVHVAIEEDPLYVAHVDGLGFDQVVEILRAHGHYLTQSP